MSRILTVLAAQVAPVAWDPAATLDRFEEHVRSVRHAFPEVGLMIFPELYLTAVDAFTDGGADDWERRVAEEIPGPLTDRVGKIAAKAKRWVGARALEKPARAGRVKNPPPGRSTSDPATTSSTPRSRSHRTETSSPRTASSSRGARTRRCGPERGPHRSSTSRTWAASA